MRHFYPVINPDTPFYLEDLPFRIRPLIDADPHLDLFTLLEHYRPTAWPDYFFNDEAPHDAILFEERLIHNFLNEKKWQRVIYFDNPVQNNCYLLVPHDQKH